MNIERRRNAVFGNPLKTFGWLRSAWTATSGCAPQDHEGQRAAGLRVSNERTDFQESMEEPPQNLLTKAARKAPFNKPIASVNSVIWLDASRFLHIAGWYQII